MVVGDTAFYTRKEIKDCVAYLRVLANPRDTVSFGRIINTPPRKIGPGTLDKLQVWAESLPWEDGMPQTPGAALLRRRWADPDVPDDQMLPDAEAMGLGKAAHRAVGAFVRAMRELEDFMDVSTPGELIQEVIRQGGVRGVRLGPGERRRALGIRQGAHLDRERTERDRRDGLAGT